MCCISRTLTRKDKKFASERSRLYNASLSNCTYHILWWCWFLKNAIDVNMVTFVNGVFHTSCTLRLSFTFFPWMCWLFLRYVPALYVRICSGRICARSVHQGVPGWRVTKRQTSFPLKTKQETQLLEDDGCCCNPHRKELNRIQLSRAPSYHVVREPLPTRQHFS